MYLNFFYCLAPDSDLFSYSTILESVTSHLNIFLSLLLSLIYFVYTSLFFMFIVILEYMSSLTINILN